MSETINNQNNLLSETAELPAATSEVKHEITIYAEPITQIGSLPITNALVTGWVAVVFVLIISVIIRAKLREIPKGLQNFVEAIHDGAIDLCDQVTGNRKISDKVFPLALSIFIFILINNWFGLLPLGGFGLIEQGHDGAAFIPLWRGGTADLNTTIALSIMAVLGANVFGIFSIGIWKTFNKYVNLRALGQIFTKARKEPTILVVAPVTFFVGLLELIGEFAKIASLSFRLFGNIFAGEVLLGAMAAILPYFLPIPFFFLEIFVGAIQALIFAILTLVYFTIASQDHDEHEENHEHAAA